MSDIRLEKWNATIYDGRTRLQDKGGHPGFTCPGCGSDCLYIVSKGVALSASFDTDDNSIRTSISSADPDIRTGEIRVVGNERSGVISCLFTTFYRSKLLTE